jgi:GWxTD domain-containing protein
MMRNPTWLLAAVIALAAVGTTQSFTAPSSEPRADVYRKWVDEDVRYIITPEERSQYSTLKTDKERDEFVAQFWLKRDPTPDTEENEYKEEHYRRIAYSNEHFATKLPGWRTDRGRAYIVYGPPDTIKEEKTGVPEQTWIYRRSATQQMTLHFVYSIANGEYVLRH